MKPDDIEALSFEIIDREAGEHRFSPDEWQIVRRMIHTSADFEYIRTVCFHPEAIEAGIRAIISGKAVITDTEMALSGISKNRLERFGATASCFIHHPDVIRRAAESGTTRACAAADFAIPLMEGGIYAVGNAPTALLRLIELIRENKIRPALVIGLPVGFVNAEESKAALMKLDCPFISSKGRKGGSNIAAGVINALLRLADEREVREVREVKKAGKLFGIGVGPGDPELMPAKSIRILSTVDTVFAATSTKNKYSLAVSIARRYIPEHTPIIMLSFPMTKDSSETQKAWKEHAETIVEYLEQGKNAAFLTLGDTLTYSTFGYILRNIRAKSPHIPVETIPGITSYQAAAARLNTPLVEGEESLMITSGVHGGDHLREFSSKPENVVFLKAYKNIKDISLALEESGLLENSVGISNCGMPDEEIINDIRTLCDRPPGYWTLILAKQNAVLNSPS